MNNSLNNFISKYTESKKPFVNAFVAFVFSFIIMSVILIIAKIIIHPEMVGFSL